MGFAWTDLKLINASRVQAHGLQESEHAMDTILTASFGTHLPVAVILLRLAMASILGLVIGIEREARDRPAGLRTHMLTALAAAVFSLIAIEMMESFGADDRRTQLDPIRVVEAVTAGVAFLAAGTILQARGSVKGLTTGAGMWLAGAIGLACGAGYLTLAILAALFAVLILLPIGILEDRIFEKRHSGKEEKSNDA